MLVSRLKTFPFSILALLVTLTLGVYMLTYRAVIQSGDTLRALDAVTSQGRYGDWLMDESNWFKQASKIREASALPLREYDVEERLNTQLAIPLLHLADTLPRLGAIHTVWLFNVFVTSLIVGLIFCLARALQYGDPAAAIVAVTAGLGTNLWSYSQTFFREPLSALFVVSALLLIRLGHERPMRLRLLSLGAGAVSLTLAILTKHSAVFAIPAALVFAIPEPTGAERPAHRRFALLSIALAGAAILALMIIDPLPRPLLGLLERGGLKAEFTGAALRSYLLSPGASIWGTSPIVLLAIAGCSMLWREKRYTLVSTVIALLFCYAVGHALILGAHWFGGLSWPPRFLLPVLPILMLATAPVAEKVARRGVGRLRILWVALLLYGAWIQFSGVSLSWSHYGDTLPAESQGLAEWLPSMFQPQYFRWVLLPQRWDDLGIDFLWTRGHLPFWGISFIFFIAVCAWALIRILRNHRSRWRYAAPLLTLICLNLILLNLSAAYFRDPRTQSAQLALHEVRRYLTKEAVPDDILLLPGNDYGNFALNHFDDTGPRVIVLPRPLAQAASDRQPARIISENPNSWFDVQSLRVIQHVASQHDRIWVLDNTSEFMPWSFRPLERYLAMHYYFVQELSLSSADDTVRLLEYSAEVAAPDPMTLYFGESSANLRYGDSVQLVSFVLPKGNRFQPGAAVPFSLLWRTTAELDRDYTVATFIVDAGAGKVVAQGYDSRPQGGFSGTSEWARGASVWDNRAIRFPAEVEDGAYRIWVIMYSIEPESGEIARLQVEGAEVAGDGTIGVLPMALDVQS